VNDSNNNSSKTYTKTDNSVDDSYNTKTYTKTSTDTNNSVNDSNNTKTYNKTSAEDSYNTKTYTKTSTDTNNSVNDSNNTKNYTKNEDSYNTATTTSTDTNNSVNDSNNTKNYTKTEDSYNQDNDSATGGYATATGDGKVEINNSTNDSSTVSAQSHGIANRGGSVTNTASSAELNGAVSGIQIGKAEDAVAVPVAVNTMSGVYGNAGITQTVQNSGHASLAQQAVAVTGSVNIPAPTAP
jgi:hypothetical protein